MKTKKDDIEKIIETYDIHFNDVHHKTMFDSHMKSLYDRIKNGEVLELEKREYEGILSELSDQALEIADQLMDIMFEGINKPSSKMELVLIATHIQNCINQR